MFLKASKNTSGEFGVVTNLSEQIDFVSAINSRMLNGRQMRTFTTDRRGKVLTESEVFTHSSGKTYTRVTTNTYDRAERLKASTVVENGKTARIERSYGNNGLLSLETFGNKLKRAYTYDIHGWLTKSRLASPMVMLSSASSTQPEQYYSTLDFGTPIVTPGTTIVDLTEQLLYAEGSNALYSGCPSAKITIQGGRYDYTFDNHRRLSEAKYSSSRKNEDFSTSYTYDVVANPEHIVRMGVINVSSTGAETFGILDSLYYCYDGNQIDYVGQFGQGTDFYGRTGYPLQDGTYTWNEAGLLNSDSSRGILSTTYNHQGLPDRQTYPGLTPTTYSANGYVYSADGTLLSIRREAKVGTISSFRYYSGNRIFENNTLEYSYFPGGYFDSAGAAHYTHTDYQGSIIAVTDSLGKVVQTTGYYPYGEPWREPSGQPMLFAGKERTPQADYLFGPRRQIPALGLWDAPDRKAHNYTKYSPYSYCFGNPVANIDPTGNSPLLVGSIIGGAIAGAVIDAGVQIAVTMSFHEMSFSEAARKIDLTSVGKSAILGAIGVPLGSLSKVPSTINQVKNLEHAITAAEVALEVADAAVDYSIDDGLSVIGPNSDDKKCLKRSLILQEEQRQQLYQKE